MTKIIEVVMTPPQLCAGENLISAILGVHVTPKEAADLINNYEAEYKNLPLNKQWLPETEELLRCAFAYWGYADFFGFYSTVDKNGVVYKKR